MFCRKELNAVRLQIDQCLEHLAEAETLPALGAWDGLEPRVISIGCALRLIARVYPRSADSHKHKNQQQE